MAASGYIGTLLREHPGSRPRSYGAREDMRLGVSPWLPVSFLTSVRNIELPTVDYLMRSFCGRGIGRGLLFPTPAIMMG